MCGIVGLFLKNPKLNKSLGSMTASMLYEMRERGPDSAGFAVYQSSNVPEIKITLLDQSGGVDFSALVTAIEAAFSCAVEARIVHNHAFLRTNADGAEIRRWIIQKHPEITVLSVGHSLEMVKAIGDPKNVMADYDLSGYHGSHAIAHTRMATESAITTAGSHPFSTGSDTCLVHNGSLSNHNNVRTFLQAKGESFQTENDSEVAAGYLAWRMRSGDSLQQAIDCALQDLDGFYTFAIGTREGFAVVRDPIGCKPAIIAETEDWVAMSSEFRAIATLPNVAQAKIWEPEPATIYSWEH